MNKYRIKEISYIEYDTLRPKIVKEYFIEQRFMLIFWRQIECHFIADNDHCNSFPKIESARQYLNELINLKKEIRR